MNSCLDRAWTHLICRASGQDELTVRIEGEAVDLSSVGVHRMAGLGCVVRPCIPAVQTKEHLFKKRVETMQQHYFSQVTAKVGEFCCQHSCEHLTS